ncbi:hypothetical protein TWF694_011479 [Orbilia ellipsospora]|uniref:DNA-binding protein RAP1 n=1 Tax=Orbilia ellipsospora TaxID=2528407 RepID=A0AAV9X5L7_9PEZI
MADEDEDSTSRLLFTDLTFHLTSHCPLKDHFKKLVEVNGGKLCKTDVGAKLVISDHLKSRGTVDKAVSYKWIEVCVQKGELVDIDPYRITNLQVNGGVAPKKSTKATAASITREVDATRPTPTVPGRRNPFTREDDCILLWWLQYGAQLGGNEIYKDLGEAFPSHGWAGWRNRWVKILSKESQYASGPKPPDDFDITTVKGWNPRIRRPDLLMPYNHEISRDNSFPENRDERNEELSTEPQRRPKRNERSALPKKPATPEAAKKKAESPSYEKFSVDEQRALFAIVDLLLLGDTPEERVEICEPLTEQFPNRAADEFLLYFMEEMKPVVKRLRLRGKVKTADLEEAVLKSLNKDEAGLTESLNNRSGEKMERESAEVESDLQKKDTRFEHLPRETPQLDANNRNTVLSANSPNQTQASPDIRSAPPRISSKENPSEEERAVAPVLVYTPQKHRRTRSDLDSPVSFYTPGTSTSNRTSGSSPLSLRRNPPSGSGSPTPRKATETVDLTDNDRVGANPKSNPLSDFTPSTYAQLFQERQKTGENVPASSPPGLIKRSSPKAFQSSPKRPTQPRLRSPILTSSTNYEESDPIPFAEPTKTAASAKKGGRISSSAQSAKRRKVGSENSRLVVESTPEHKLFPPPAPLTSSVAGSSPNTMNRLFNQQPSPGQSPLARKSIRKKISIDNRILENQLSSQATEIAEQPSENEIFDGELAGTQESNIDGTGDTTEEEADPMELDSVTNRNLGILNDMSPTPNRRSTCPLFFQGETTEEEIEEGEEEGDEEEEEGDDDTISQSSEYEMSQEERVRRIKEGLDSIDLMMDTFPAKYGVTKGDVALVIDRTTADRELIEFILTKLAEHKDFHGNLDDFEWPERRGIWTEEEDEVFAEDSPSEEALAALTRKHGNQGVMMRWEFLAATNYHKNV